MANTDAYYGFKPVGMLSGGIMPPARLVRHTTGTAVFQYDLCKSSSGTVISCTSASDTPGWVSMEYVASGTATGETFLAMPLVQGLILKAQVDDSSLSDYTTNYATRDYILTHGGSTTTGVSGMEIDGDGTSNNTFLILGKVPQEGNAWGAQVEIYVTPAVTEFAQS